MKKTRLQENAFRSLVRNEIVKILQEEEGDAQETPKEEPKAKKPEQDRGEILDKVTYSYVKAVKNNLQQLSVDEMADAFDSVMSSFGLGKDTKMEVLKSIRNKVQL